MILKETHLKTIRVPGEARSPGNDQVRTAGEGVSRLIVATSGFTPYAWYENTLRHYNGSNRAAQLLSTNVQWDLPPFAVGVSPQGEI